MSKRSYGIAVAVLLLGLVPTAAYAGSRASASGSTSSCVDFNNNGVCDTGDVPLLPLLQGSNGVVNTANIARPATVNGPAGPVGIVLDDMKLPGVGALLVTTGDVHVNGSLKTEADGLVNIHTTGGNIDVAPGASINVGDLAGALVTQTGDIHIGAGAKISTHGGDSVSNLNISGNNVTIDDNVKLTAQGYNAALSVNAAGTLTVGQKDSFLTSGPDEGPGPVTLTGHSDVTLDGVKLAGRGVTIRALSTTGGPSRHISVSNSAITIVHGDGIVGLQADGADATNAFDSVRLNPSDVHVEANPAVTITNSAKNK
jgi:hypothetical protein